MKKFLLALLLSLLPLAAFAVTEDELLPPDKAFRFSATLSGEAIRAEWNVAAGYYLYRDKLKFTTQTPGIQLGEALFPAAKKKHDEFFGDVAIYSGKVTVTIPYQRTATGPVELVLTAESQGCAEAGVCYPPHRQTATLMLAAAPAPKPALAASPFAELLPGSGFGNDEDILPPDQAFELSAEAQDTRTVVAHWRIAPEHYLYRDKFTFAVKESPGTLGNAEIPAGEEKNDEAFGLVRVFHDEVTIRLPVTSDAETLNIEFGYQGCAEAGICYPPIRKVLKVDLSAAGIASAAAVSADPSEAGGAWNEASLMRMLEQGSAWAVMLAALGAGVLMAFTACMYPMIPILSSIIVGQGQRISPAKGFGLSLIYVVSVAITFGVIGGVAAVVGQGVGIQAYFQSPWLLIPFTLLFIALALAMFGLYDLQVPSAIQTRLNALTNEQKGGTFVGVGLMGVFSALIVGPCGGPFLLAALTFAASSGSVAQGFGALFSLGFGMGLPLLLVGLGGGTLLPRAGNWMGTVKAAAGVILLAVALQFLERMPSLFPPTLVMLLWATLLIGVGVFLRALEPVQAGASGWQRVWKGLGVTMILYGVIVMLGGLTGGSSVTDPLHGSRLLAASTLESGGAPAFAPGAGAELSPAAAQAWGFKRIKSVADLHRELAAAKAAHKTVMLDFYADWCSYCKKFEMYVFTDPGVRQALAETVLLQADVTATDELDRALMESARVALPPAILFFDAEGSERSAHRVVGYMKPEDFRRHIQKAFQS